MRITYVVCDVFAADIASSTTCIATSRLLKTKMKLLKNSFMDFIRFVVIVIVIVIIIIVVVVVIIMFIIINIIIL